MLVPDTQNRRSTRKDDDQQLQMNVSFKKWKMTLSALTFSSSDVLLKLKCKGEISH